MSTSIRDAEPVHSCVGCGASIYREHLDRGVAGYRAGRMLCRHCMTEANAAGKPAAAAPSEAAKAATMPAPAVAAPTPVSSSSDPLGPLPLADPDEVVELAAPSTGARPSVIPEAAPQKEPQFQRPLNPVSRGATRVRTFHSKLSDAAVHNMDQVVNSWLDQHPDIEIKFATSAIGPWEGKHPEPNLILTLFY